MNEGVSSRLARAPRCARCRYSLQGLPSPWQCPECGLAFDDHSRTWRPRSLTVFIGLRIVVLVVLIIAWAFARSVWLNPPVWVGRVVPGMFVRQILTTLILVLLFAWTVMGLMQYLKNPLVALTPGGVLIRQGSRPERLIPYDGIVEVVRRHVTPRRMFTSLVLNDSSIVDVTFAVPDKDSSTEFSEGIHAAQDDRRRSAALGTENQGVC